MAAATIITNVVTGGSNNHSTVASEGNAYATDFVSQGVLGSITSTGGIAPTTGSFGVNQNTGSNMAVNILGSGVTGSTAAVAYVTCTPTGQDKQVLRARMTSDYTAYAINANASGSTQFDWIYLQADPTNANTPSAASDNVVTIITARGTSNSSAPAGAPTYGTLLAVVTVANGATAITNANISDRRTLATLTGSATSSTSGWTPLATGPSTITALGNRSYTVVFNGADYTSLLSPGMRLQFTRTAAAPTLCTSLNGTTQYFSKSSPAGMTFTNNFVVSAWVKVASYPSVQATIASRTNNTSGWSFDVDSIGQVRLIGYNASSANVSLVQSYQSIPLNRWVHVAAQLDMATFTATPTTSYTMIDGLDVPASVTRGGTNPTALIQAGNLEIGSRNATPDFPGKIAQVAIYSAKVTEAMILASISQTLVGTETNLISVYTLSNSVTDLVVGNANNLSVGGGSATTTTADSPYAQGASAGTIEYGIITAASFSTNTTLTVQVPEGSAMPSTGGVGATSYSTQKVPYLLPAQHGKWKVFGLWVNSEAVSTTPANQWFPTLGVKLTVPVGAWELGYQGSLWNSGTAGTRSASITLASSAPTNALYTQNELAEAMFSGASAGDLVVPVRKQSPISLAAATLYTVYFSTSVATGSDLIKTYSNGFFEVAAHLGYL